MTEIVRCIVCDSPDCKHGYVGDVAHYVCPRCGNFALTGTAAATLSSKVAEVGVRRSIMSHALRRMQHQGQPHPIDANELPSLWGDHLPTPQQQADNLIRWIGDQTSDSPSEFTEGSTASVLAAIIGLPISPGADSQGLGWLNAELEKRHLYTLRDDNGKIRFRLSMLGWQQYEDLKKTHAESRIAFMAMKFGDPLLDKVVEQCFKPAVERSGFQLRRLIDEQPAGLIDDQLRAAILSARFLVSDLTHGSHGAYWEAGFAEGLNLPVIYTCQSKKWDESRTHFDTNHLKTIIWDESDLASAGKELTATIRATLRADAKQSDD